MVQFPPPVYRWGIQDNVAVKPELHLMRINKLLTGLKVSVGKKSERHLFYSVTAARARLYVFFTTEKWCLSYDKMWQTAVEMLPHSFTVLCFTACSKSRTMQLKMQGHVIMGHFLQIVSQCSITGGEKCGFPEFFWNCSMKRVTRIHTRNRES